jgi:hypothetical protein
VHVRGAVIDLIDAGPYKVHLIVLKYIVEDDGSAIEKLREIGV